MIKYFENQDLREQITTLVSLKHELYALGDGFTSTIANNEEEKEAIEKETEVLKLLAGEEFLDLDEYSDKQEKRYSPSKLALKKHKFNLS